MLSGAIDENRAQRLEAALRAFSVESMLDDRLAVIASRNYRALRATGITIRRATDVIIGTFCMERGYALLHNDRDFEPMHERLGLRRAVMKP